jgi:DNA polymerase
LDHGRSGVSLQIDCPPSYPEGCKIVFVGEAPGLEEAKHGEGFVGPAGKCLQRAASLAGLDWASCGKSNVVKRYPSKVKFEEAFYEICNEPIYTPKGNLSKKTKKVKQKTQELLEWEDLLERELRDHHPNLIVACGNQALEAICGQQGVVNLRGSVVGSKWHTDATPSKVLAVEHPSYIIRGKFVDFWILTHDLKKAKMQMEFPEIWREPYEAITKPSLDQCIGYLRDIENLGGLFTLDVETRAGTLACFAIATMYPQGITSVCIPIQTTSGPYWSPQDELEIWRALHEATSSNPNLCNQNIEYDIYYLLRYGVEPSGVYMDTMLAHSILYPEFPKSLDFLASLYLDDVVYWKDDHRDWSGRTPDEALWEYNCKDAVYTLRIVEKIDNELKRRGLYEVYHRANH